MPIRFVINRDLTHFEHNPTNGIAHLFGNATVKSSVKWLFQVPIGQTRLFLRKMYLLIVSRSCEDLNLDSALLS